MTNLIFHFLSRDHGTEIKGKKDKWTDIQAENDDKCEREGREKYSTDQNLDRSVLPTSLVAHLSDTGYSPSQVYVFWVYLRVFWRENRKLDFKQQWHHPLR